MPDINKVIFVDSLGGRTPACVNRENGYMYIDSKWWNKLPFEHRLFILLHEKAHAVLGTKNEFLADRQAFKWYAKRGHSLTQATRSLTRVLNYSGYGRGEHINRTLSLINQAEAYDIKHNRNKNKWHNQFYKK